MDPIVVDDDEINQMRELIEQIVKEMNVEYSIHDFRMTDGGERINLIFDLVVPREENIDKNEIEQKIKEKIHSIDKRYYAVLKIEHLYI